MTTLRLYDAHNHLQDDRIGGVEDALVAECRRVGVKQMVVNGSGAGDWRAVAALARTYPDLVIPSFGLHPWYVAEQDPAWRTRLEDCLGHLPAAAVGEIGLDLWKPGLAYEGQEEAFVFQLRLAAERQRPVSIHCLRAWGRLAELLRANPRPACGFLLHSYGGPKEMVEALADLGAYFSLPGNFALARKERQREAFRVVPRERLLLETDAPDQRLPSPEEAAPAFREAVEMRDVPDLRDPANDRPLNHPACLPAVYRFAAALLEERMEALAVQVEANFRRLFGRCCGS